MNRPNLFLALTALMLAPSFAARAADATAARPNVLFVIADDASRHFGEAYGCKWVKTPNIDRLAKQGLVTDRNLLSERSAVQGELLLRRVH